MNTSEALNIMGFSNGGEVTRATLKKQFVKLIKEHHPDHGGSHGMALLIIQAKEKLEEAIEKPWFAGQIASEDNLKAAFMEQLNKIKHLPDIEIEVCGTWLWISGNTKPYKEIFKENGFKWSRKKSMWSWHPGTFRKFKKQTTSINDIRLKYGSVKIEKENLTAIAC